MGAGFVSPPFQEHNLPEAKWSKGELEFWEASVRAEVIGKNM